MNGRAESITCGGSFHVKKKKTIVIINNFWSSYKMLCKYNIFLFGLCHNYKLILIISVHGSEFYYIYIYI